MPTWVCLLRAVNVGGRNRVPMADLRGALAEAGYEARTHLASGNVVVTTRHTTEAGIGDLVREAVRACAGIEVPVVSRRAEDLAQVAAACPFDPPDPKWTHAVFFPEPVPADRVAAMREVEIGAHRVEMAERVAWVHYDGTSQDQAMQKALSRLGPDGTARNWRTITTVLDLATS